MDKKYFTTEISKLLNPPLLSKYLQKQIDSAEDLYPSQKRAPLGCVRPPDIPYENLKMCFGNPTVKDISAVDLIYPSESQVYQSVYSEVYDYEKAFDSSTPAGIHTKDLDNSGEHMQEIFHPIKTGKSAIIVPSSYACKVNSARNASAYDGYSLYDCKHRGFLYDEDAVTPLKMKREILKDRNSVEVLWNLLKIKNHSNFKDLISSFRAYRNENNNLTVLDLQKMCQKFGISAPLHVIEKLFEECDIIDKDGVMSYEEFMHALNWKDLVPENANFETPRYANDWREGINSPSKDVINHFKTTSSFIGDHKYSVESRAAGMPSYNRDVSKLNLKGISEFQEHGDASSMIQPNAFVKHGVFEKDLSKLQSKEKVKEILLKSGIQFNDEAFEMVWQKVNQNSKASIGTVWNALKNICLSHFKDL